MRPVRRFCPRGSSVVDDQVAFSLVFAAGVVVECLYLALSGLDRKHPRDFRRRVALAVLVGSGGLLPGRDIIHYSLHIHLALAVLLVAVGFFIVFQDEILPRLGEANLLIQCIAFWCLAATVSLDGHPPILLMAIAAFPTAVIVIAASRIRMWGFTVKLICYASFCW